MSEWDDFRHLHGAVSHHDDTVTQPSTNTERLKRAKEARERQDRNAWGPFSSSATDRDDIRYLSKSVETLVAENERLRKLDIPLSIQQAHDAAQVIEGWRNTTPTNEWSEYDQAARDGIGALLKRLYAALEDQHNG